ncbi:MAG: hypothetical protein K2L70_05720 [Clostridia bacterium]|nr:hypothetical protein [Clostridia bacterium]
MNEKKKEELEKMYALRAGLSVISEKYDDLIKDNNIVHKMQIEVSQLKKPNYKGETIYDVDKRVADMNHNESVLIDSSTQILLHLCKELKDENKLFFYFVRKCVPSIIDFFQDVILDNTSDFSGSLWLILMILGYILIVPISIPIIIFDIIAFPFILFKPSRLRIRNLLKAIKKDKNYEYIKQWGKNHPNDSTYMYDNTVKSLIGMLEDSEYKFTKLDNKLIKEYKAFSPTAIVQLQNYFKNAKELMKQIGEVKIAQQKEEFKIQCEDYERNKKEKQCQYERKIDSNNQLTLLVSTESQTISNALKTTYSSILDIRDWENLDLVIYYYETGRADSIKEALQLVDLERRNNNLMNCIQQASNEISSSIKTGISELGSAMIQGFESLSAQINAQRIQTIDALNGLKSLNSKVNKNLVEISKELNTSISQQQLSNALLAKANVSSKQMVEQMKTLNSKIKSA